MAACFVDCCMHSMGPSLSVAAVRCPALYSFFPSFVVFIFWLHPPSSVFAFVISSRHIFTPARGGGASYPDCVLSPCLAPLSKPEIEYKTRRSRVSDISFLHPCLFEEERVNELDAHLLRGGCNDLFLSYRSVTADPLHVYGLGSCK